MSREPDRVKLRERARDLRRSATDAERLLWQRLRGRRINDFKFRRQFVIAPYIVDFVCLDVKLIVEVDGSQHAEQRTYDTRRTGYLEQRGYRVLRFWNNDVLRELASVLERIEIALKTHPPQPSRKGTG